MNGPRNKEGDTLHTIINTITIYHHHIHTSLLCILASFISSPPHILTLLELALIQFRHHIVSSISLQNKTLKWHHNQGHINTIYVTRFHLYCPSQNAIASVNENNLIDVCLACVRWRDDRSVYFAQQDLCFTHSWSCCC